MILLRSCCRPTPPQWVSPPVASVIYIAYKFLKEHMVNIIEKLLTAFKGLIGDRNGAFQVSYRESQLQVGEDLFFSLFLGLGGGTEDFSAIS